MTIVITMASIRMKTGDKTVSRNLGSIHLTRFHIGVDIVDHKRVLLIPFLCRQHSRGSLSVRQIIDFNNLYL